MADPMSKPRSFAAFQQLFEKRIAVDPVAHSYSMSDFVYAWRRAIERKLSRLHTVDPNYVKMMLNLSLQHEMDLCDLEQIGREIYYQLMFAHFGEITKRTASFRYFCDYYDISAGALSEENFVQAWKDYVTECEQSFNSEEHDEATIHFERELFLADSLDSDPRGSIHEMLVERNLLPE